MKCIHVLHRLDKFCIAFVDFVLIPTTSQSIIEQRESSSERTESQRKDENPRDWLLGSKVKVYMRLKKSINMCFKKLKYASKDMNQQ